MQQGRPRTSLWVQMAQMQYSHIGEENRTLPLVQGSIHEVKSNWSWPHEYSAHCKHVLINLIFTWGGKMAILSLKMHIFLWHFFCYCSNIIAHNQLTQSSDFSNLDFFQKSGLEKSRFEKITYFVWIGCEKQFFEHNKKGFMKNFWFLS